MWLLRPAAPQSSVPSRSASVSLHVKGKALCKLISESFPQCESCRKPETASKGSPREGVPDAKTTRGERLSFFKETGTLMKRRPASMEKPVHHAGGLSADPGVVQGNLRRIYLSGTVPAKP